MATKTPQAAEPSAGANPCWCMSPPASITAALSPSFSRAPFRAHLGTAAAAASSSSPDEHPCVTLWDWWLERVEADEQKIAVSGFTERNIAFTSAPIAKRYEALTLEDEDGLVVFIHGSLSISRMRENGFSAEICQKFMIGFPYWWESWHSRMGSQPSSSNTSNSREGSAQFYLEAFQLGNFLDSVGSSFIGNLLNKAKSFSSDDADAFKEGSYLSNETPRFEDCTCDIDISTKEKSVASNDGSEGSAAVAKEVDNMEIDSIVGSTSQERGHVDVSLAPKEKCTSDETYKEAGDQNDSVHPDAREQETGSRRTRVASLKNQGCLKRTQHIAFNQKVVPIEDTSTSVHSDVLSLENSIGPTKEQRSAHEVLRGPTRSPMIGSSIPYLTRAKAKSLSISTPESLKMRRTKSGRVVVPPLDPGSEKIVYDINGMILGVAGMELQSPLRGSKSKSGTPARAR